MVRNKAIKATFLVIFLVSMGFLGSSILLKVTITDEDLNYTVDSLDYRQDASPLHQVNATLRNTGSVGCEYTLESVYQYGDREESRYSKTKPLWSGGMEFFDIYNVARNYTGEVNTTLYLHYCDRVSEIQKFSFESKGKEMVPNKTFKSSTIDSNSSGATLEIDLAEGRLVPFEGPAAWKIAGSKIDKERSRVSYDPEIFTGKENITYMVLDGEGEVLGTTRVNLEPEKDLISIIGGNVVKLLFGLSIIVNLVLLFRKVLPASLEEQFKQVEG